jgi:hypothetical protein
MDIYHYDQTTGEYLAPGTADPSPLEPGAWLIPAGATIHEPPAARDGTTRHWNGGGWEFRDIPPPDVPA